MFFRRSCCRHLQKRSLNWNGVNACFSSWSSRKNNWGPSSASRFRRGCIERRKPDERKLGFGGVRERRVDESRVMSSDFGRGGENFDDLGKSEEEDEEEDEEENEEDIEDDFKVLDSFRRNRDIRDSSRRIELNEDDSKHPLVREISRLINQRASWTPKLESELKNLLRRLTPSQVCAVLKAQTDERVALKFFYWADRQWRYKHDPIVHYVMLKILSKTKLCQGAKRILQLMSRRKIKLWPEDFGCVMVSFSRAGELRKSLQMLTVMQRAGVELDILICNTAVNVLVEGKKMDKAFRFLERMKLVDIEPDVITYNSLIKGFCEENKIEDAIKLIEEMPRKGVFPDKVSYYTVMGFLCKEKRVPQLRGLMEKMLQNDNLLPDQVTYGMLIHLLSKYGHAEEALEFLREAEKKGFSIDKVGHTAIVNCFCQERKMDRAKAIVDDMFSKGCTPDVVTYTAILNGFCKVGEVDQAKKMLQQMYKHDCKPNCFSYTALLNGLCRSGKSLEARDMMSVSEGWWTPNAVTYSVIMHGFRREGRLSEACDMVSEMIKNGFFPNPVEINLLIRSLCQGGKTNQARKLMEECLKNDCAVNVVNFTSVIHGFCKNDDLDTALSVFDDMYLNNKHPDEVTYTTVIDALARKGRIDEAVEMMKKLLHSGYLPTPVTYRSVIHHFCQHGKVEELLEVLDKMLARMNYRMAYNQIIEKLCYFGQMDEAYKLLGKVLRTASEIDANTCHVLMKCFLKNGNPVESYRVACRMFNRNMIPDLKLCEQVSKRLIAEKKLDEADKLMLRFVERGRVLPKARQAA